MTASNVVASMSGCAGQRCMAASRDDGRRQDRPHHRAHGGARAADGARARRRPGDLRARRRSASSATSPRRRQAGAEVLVDGRNATVPGREGGYYVGPTIIDHVTPDMRIAQEEVFGPVLVIIRAPRRRRGARRRERLALRQRGVGVHRERRRRALRHGARQRRHGRRERRRAGAARAVRLRRLERVEVRRRRHHRPRLDRVLDAGRRR